MWKPGLPHCRQTQLVVSLVGVCALYKTSPSESKADGGLDGSRKEVPAMVPAPASIPPKWKPLDVSDQKTYLGRLKRLLRMMHPRNIALTESEVRRFQARLQEGKASEEDLHLAATSVAACCNPVSGEVIPPPFRLPGFLLGNIPIVAAMVFTTSIPVQVLAHWVNQSLNSAVNYYNRSGSSMEQSTVAKSYLLAVGTACPLAFGLGKVFQHAPPSIKRLSFAAPYVAVAAAGTANLLFTRQAEMDEGVAVKDITGEERGVSKEAGRACVLQTVLSRCVLMPLPVVVLPVGIVAMVKRVGLMPLSPRAQLGVQLAAITVSLGVALPLSIAVFPQEASFSTDSLEPEFRNLKLRDGSGKVAKVLYANKGL